MHYTKSLKISEKTISELLENTATIPIDYYKSFKASTVPINPIYSQPVNSIIDKGSLVNTYQKTPISSYYEITELFDDYRFIYPIMIKVVNFREDNIFVAECSTFNLYSHAETYEEALDGIKSLLIDDYLSFKKDYPDGLTDTAISVLRLYCAFFGQNLP